MKRDWSIWMIDNKVEQMMSVVEMKTFRWNSGMTREFIFNENVRGCIDMTWTTLDRID